MHIKKYDKAGSYGAKNTAKTMEYRMWRQDKTDFRVLREGMAGEVIATCWNK